VGVDPPTVCIRQLLVLAIFHLCLQMVYIVCVTYCYVCHRSCSSKRNLTKHSTTVTGALLCCSGTLSRVKQVCVVWYKAPCLTYHSGCTA
jgi:hypothetical protein